MAKPGYDDRDFEAHLRDGERLRDRALEELARALRSGRMCAFTGSYLNVELGYDKWNAFLLKGFDHDKATAAASSGRSNLIQELVAALKKADADDKPFPLIDYEILIELIKANEPGVEVNINIRDGEQHKSVQPDRRHGLTEHTSASRIVDQLGIRRIITLNYDFEHELASLTNARELTRARGEAAELLRERGEAKPDRVGPYSAASTPDSSHRLQLHAADGSLMVSDCFSRERTDRLFEFAIGSSYVDRHVLHLHGRQDVPASMVVTYSHYEALYRRSSLTKLPFEFAMRTLFAGNPTLFVGVGLSEDEILFHLRQFVSDGPQARLAPHFIIWSADNKNTGSRKKDTISLWEEIRRLRWYRQFGIYTIYDVELEAYRRKLDNDPSLRLFNSLDYLAAAGAKKMAGFSWRREDFRSIARHLDAVDADGHVSLWGPDESQAQPLPDWELSEQVRAESVDFEDRLTRAIDFGRPIKAFLDKPGSGHGYIARLLRDLIVRRNQTRTSNFPIFRVFQINAGFAWEIDSTFELISGSFDSRSAFAERKSRRKSLDDYLGGANEVLKNFASALDGVGQDTDAKVVLIINGADRYFDPNGYPLSAELDNQIRTMANVFRKTGAFDRTAVPNPVSLFLFGTARIARYLQSLGMLDPRNDLKRLVDIYGSLPAPLESQQTLLNNGTFADQLNLGTPFRFRTGTRTLNRMAIRALPIRGWAPLELSPAAQRSGFAPSGAGEFKSAYLRYAEANFRARLRQHDPKYLLPGTNRSLLDRHRHGRPSEQRQHFVDAYLQPAVLWRCFTSSGGDQEQAGLQAELTMAILRSMAFVGQPVEVSTLAAIPAVKDLLKDGLTACATHGPASLCNCALSAFMEDLRKLALVVRMERYPGSTDSVPSPAQQVGERYGLHRALLHEIRDRHTLPISDARTYTSFNIPLFAAQPIDEAEPNQEVYEELQNLVEELIATPPDRLDKARPVHGARLRAAMASIRSYYTTSVLLMHEPEPAPSEVRSARLTEHARIIERLLKSFEDNAEQRREQEKTELWLLEQPRYAFPDDILWLHDQRGVSLLAQGDLYEARHAFREARRINKEFVEYDDHYQNWRRLELNELHVDIERGKLGVAQDKLRLLEEAVNAQCDAVDWVSRAPKDPVTDEPYRTAFEAIVVAYGHELRDRVRVADPNFPADAILTTGLLCGYRGWCNYMAGRLQSADRNFRHCINILHNLGEQRAYALFLRLHASLQRSQGDYVSAKASLDLSLKLSVSGQQMDLSHHGWIMQCELALECDPAANRGDLLHQLTNSLRYAILTDMYRLRMEARRALARLRIESGDYDGAMEHATDALAVAIRCGFSLRKINIRALIGEILVRRGDPISGRAMLDQAALEADRIGYQRAVDQVHQTRMYLDLKH